jgi:hypothetical protein
VLQLNSLNYKWLTFSPTSNVWYFVISHKGTTPNGEQHYELIRLENVLAGTRARYFESWILNDPEAAEQYWPDEKDLRDAMMSVFRSTSGAM